MVYMVSEKHFRNGLSVWNLFKMFPDDEAAEEWFIKQRRLEDVKGDCHTNGVESFWSMLKRAHMGTFHKISERHLHKYVGGLPVGTT